MPNETGVPTLQELLSQANDIATSKRKVDDNDNLAQMLKLLQIDSLQTEREERATTALGKQSTDSGITQMVPSMQRIESLSPGAMSGKGEFKSVGGLKNLVPTVGVPIAEKLHEFTGGLVGMQPGSADERAAIQDLVNTKIYDSSGKAVSIPETARIESGMGLKGMFDPSATNQALKQLGESAFQKQKNITAGARPSAVKTFKERGGMAGFNSLQEMLAQPSTQAAQPKAAPQPAIPAAAPAAPVSPQQRLQQLRAKYPRK